MKVHEITAKSIFVPSKLPDTDYVINPYVGCVFGCAYCYASFMGRFVGESFQNWGSYLYAKINAPELLRKELQALDPKIRNSRVLLSSVTDAYQYAEKKYQLTRRILEILVEYEYPGLISILTKSPLVIRDIDLLKRLKSSEVGFTITTIDDLASRELEVRAPKTSERLIALRKLNEAGINTYAFIGPLLPHFYDRPKLLEELFASIASTGISSIFLEHMNLKQYIRKRLVDILTPTRPNASELYTPEHEQEAMIEINALIYKLAKHHHLELRLGQVLKHGKEPNNNSV
jgi:DNA repair photolyase